MKSLFISLLLVTQFSVYAQSANTEEETSTYESGQIHHSRGQSSMGSTGKNAVENNKRDVTQKMEDEERLHEDTLPPGSTTTPKAPSDP